MDYQLVNQSFPVLTSFYPVLCRILARVYEMDLKEDISVPHAHDPYSDDSKAPFYRKPVGLRRAIKHAEKEEEGNNQFSFLH